MSGQSDMNLDDILAEFYREENRAAQAPAPKAAPPRSARTKPAEPILSSEQKAAEGTLLYESRPARHAAPAAEPTEAEVVRPEPAPPQQEEKPVQRPAEKAEPKPRAEKPAPRQEKTPAPRRQAEKQPPRRSPGKGFALMILVLLLLCAALAGLLRWTALAEETAAPQEAEPLRLELGLSLERSLDESAATTR